MKRSNMRRSDGDLTRRAIGTSQRLLLEIELMLHANDRRPGRRLY